MPNDNMNETYEEAGEESSKSGKDTAGKGKAAANTLGKAEVMNAVKEYRKTMAEYRNNMTAISCGVNYPEADVLNLQKLMQFGPIDAFYQDNKWIFVKEEKDAYMWGGGKGLDEKQFVIDFMALVRATTEFRREYARFMDIMINDSLYAAYKMIRFYETMREAAPLSILDGITSAFAEFDNLINKYNSYSIFESLDFTNDDTLADRTENVLWDMDTAVGNKPNLGKFLVKATQTNADGVNKLYILDSLTKEFSRYATKADRFRKHVAEIRDLKATCDNFVGLNPGEFNDFLWGYFEISDVMINVFERAISEIESFRTKKNEAPYAVMHYSPLIKDCTTKHMLGTLNNAMEEGTNYSEIARSMVSRFRSVASTIAKTSMKEFPPKKSE